VTRSRGDSGDRPGTGGTIWGVPRAPPVFALPGDGGATLPARRIQQDGSGCCPTGKSRDRLNKKHSRPPILQGPDGALHIACTCRRRAIQDLRLTLGPAPRR
jgi:predicted neuraminidase